MRPGPSRVARPRRRQAGSIDETHVRDGAGAGAAGQPNRRPHSVPQTPPALPVLLTADDAAQLLRTTRRAIYAMVERDQLPAPVRVGRRLLLRQDDLARWLETKQQAL